MRILFLHTALNGLTAEYKVHISLVMNANSDNLDPYFIWQSPVNFIQTKSDKIIPHDFGRDMSIRPPLSRYRRAGVMLQKLPQTLLFLSTKIKQIKPDALYTSQQAFDVRLASIASKYLNIPHIIHIHYNVGPWLGKHAFDTIRKSSRLIAVSEYIRQTALLQGVSPEHIHTVVNPAPVFQPPGDMEAQNIRAEFHLKETTPLVVAAGRLDPGKGHLALFEAFAHVIQHLPNARLLVCGASSSRDNYEDRLRQCVTELQIDSHVIFAGHRSDIQAIMHSSDVFCLPTELEPFGLVFLEAMMEEKPVVACYSGGVPEIVLHNQTGLLSYPGDIQTLSANLLRVLSDKAYAQQLGSAGKARVSTEFSAQKVANHWLDVVQKKLA